MNNAAAAYKLNTVEIIKTGSVRVIGWAIGDSLEVPARVALYVNGEAVAETLADKPRPKLQEKGIHPTGNCGFAFRVPGTLRLRKEDKIDVRLLSA